MTNGRNNLSSPGQFYTESPRRASSVASNTSSTIRVRTPVNDMSDNHQLFVNDGDVDDFSSRELMSKHVSSRIGSPFRSVKGINAMSKSPARTSLSNPEFYGTDDEDDGLILKEQMRVLEATDVESGFLFDDDMDGINDKDLTVSSLLDATFNFTNSIIGAGIIGIPYALLESGLVLGLILLTSLTMLIDWTVILLIRNAKLSGQTTYPSLTYHCFGYHGYIIISFFQFIFAYGAMCAYAVIIGDTVPKVFMQLLSPNAFLHGFLTSRSLMIMTCTLCIALPLSMFRDLRKLSKTSLMSLAAIGLIVIAIAIRGPATVHALKGEQSPYTLTGSAVFEAIGVISFAFVCHHNTFMIFTSLKRPSVKRFSLVAHLSTG